MLKGLKLAARQEEMHQRRTANLIARRALKARRDERRAKRIERRAIKKKPRVFESTGDQTKRLSFTKKATTPAAWLEDIPDDCYEQKVQVGMMITKRYFRYNYDRFSDDLRQEFWVAALEYPGMRAFKAAVSKINKSYCRENIRIFNGGYITQKDSVAQFAVNGVKSFIDLVTPFDYGCRSNSPKIPSNETIREMVAKHGSVPKAANALGLTYEAVRYRLRNDDFELRLKQHSL